MNRETENLIRFHQEQIERARAAAASNTRIEPECPILLTILEAQNQLSVSRSTVLRMIARGKLKKVDLFPGMPRIPRSEIERIAGGAQ